MSGKPKRILPESKFPSHNKRSETKLLLAVGLKPARPFSFYEPPASWRAVDFTHRMDGQDSPSYDGARLAFSLVALFLAGLRARTFKVFFALESRWSSPLASDSRRRGSLFKLYAF